MRYSAWDPHVLNAFAASALTQPQRGFIQWILRSLDSDSYLSNHCCSGNSISWALVRAHHAYDGYITIEQPFVGPLKAILRAAEGTLTALRPAVATDAGDLQQYDQIGELLNLIAADPKGGPDRDLPNSYHNRLSQTLLPASLYSRKWLVSLWEGNIEPEVADSMRDEIALAVALSGRSGRSLRTDLIRLFNAGPSDPEELAERFWPPSQQFRVSLSVLGARELVGLEKILPGAKQKSIPLRARVADEEARASGPSVPLDTPSARIQIPVRATDPQSAIAYARRMLSEALDQYVAGQRISDLSIGLHSQVIVPSGTLMLEHRGIAAVTAAPLTTHWPEILAPALRAGHLANRADAPMTSTLLAWSCIEATGVKSTKIEVLAKAYALQTLRQQIISTFQIVTSTARATIKHTRWQAKADRRMAVRYAKDAEAASIHRRVGEAVDRVQSEGGVPPNVMDARPESDKSRSSIEDNIKSHLNVIGNYVKFAPGDRLQDIDAWLEILLPASMTPAANLLKAQASTQALCQEVGGLALESFELWRSRLGDPLQLRTWLHGQQMTYQGLLESIYATRNAAVHAGAFSAPADVLTAHAARGLADLLLEVLGNWYENCHGTDLPAALVIVQELATRLDDLSSKLERAASCHRLTVVHITGPNGSAWI